jgi:peptidoglycan/LPS O-acetylase OafA/YrhL
MSTSRLQRPAQARGTPRHMPALDGIRGLAIALVMIHHFVAFGGMSLANRIDALFFKVAYAGWTGVQLFFVLSGFLITMILYDAKGTRHFFLTFYMRRAVRIFPLYYGGLLVLFVLIPLLTAGGGQFYLPLYDQLWYWGYGVNFLVALEGWHAYSLTSIQHFWSLAVEEQSICSGRFRSSFSGAAR